MKDLIKKYPNDLELGRAVRKRYLEEGDLALELLKEVLALHGFNHQGYPNGLIERGEYLEPEETGKWKNSCDGEMMDRLDEKILMYIEKIEEK